MPKPRKTTSDTFYDIFGSWPVEDQAIALKVLEQTHRQCVRMLARAQQPKTDAVASAAQGSLLDDCPKCVGRGYLMLSTIVDGKDRMTCPICNGVGNKKNLQGSLLDGPDTGKND